MPQELANQTKNMQEDKQIYAYSWRRDLIKKTKEYIANRRKPKEPTLAIKQENSPKELVDIQSAKTSNIKVNTKADKPVKSRASKKQKNTYTDSSIFIKERREKTLTLIIGGLILLVMGGGILIGNNVIKFPSSDPNLNSTFVSLTVTPTIEIDDKITLSVQPSKTLVVSPTPTRTQLPISPAQTNCKVGGCNGEICADETLGDISSICLYQEKYACYKDAKCERQPNGSCGWTQNSELMACLDNYN